MANDKLKKYSKTLKKHIDFIRELEPDNKKQKKELKKAKGVLKEVIEYLTGKADEDTDSAASEEVEKLQGQIQELKEELDKKEKEIEKLKEESGANEQLDEEKQKELEEEIRKELEEEYAEKLKKVEASEEQGDEDEIAKLQQKIEELETELSTKDKKLDEMESEIEEGQEPEEVEKPQDKKDIVAWELYLEQNPEDEEAISSIKEIGKEAREKEDWKLLAEVLICRFDFGIFEKNEEGIELIKEVAHIQEDKLGNYQEAFYALKILLEEKPDKNELLEDLRRLAGEGDIWDIYTVELEDIISRVGDRKILPGLWKEVAKAYNERLNNYDAALAAYQRVLELDPTNSEAMEDMASIYKKQGDWNKLISILEKRLPFTEDNEEKAYFLKEIANIKEVKLQEPIMAARTYEEVFSVVSDDLEAINALEKIYENNELWEQLAAVLKRKIESVESAEEARLARRDLGFLLAKHLDNPNRAMDILEHLVEVMHDDLKLIRVLLDLYESTGRMRDYLKGAEILAQKTEVESEKIDLYKRIASEYLLNANTRMKAAENFEKVLELKPEAEDVYDALEGIYEGENQWRKLVDTLESHIMIVDSDNAKAKLFRHLGKVYHEELENHEEARTALEKSYKLQNSDLKTVKLLSGVYSELGLYEENIPLLNKLIKKAESDSEKSSAYEQLGISQLELKQLEEAEKTLHDSLELKDDSFPTLKGLGDVYYGQGQWTRAVSYYEKAMKCTSNKLKLGDLVAKAADILSEKLNDSEKAVKFYEKLLEYSPGHPKAIRILADYYVEKEEYEKAVPLMNVVASEAEQLPKHERVQLYLKAGKIALAVDEIDKATDYLEKARSLEPTSLEVLLELAELRYTKEEWDGALSLYQALLVAHRDAISTEKIAQIYVRLGGIKEKKNDTLKAISFYDKALEADKKNADAAEALLRLREANKDYDKVAKIKQDKINAEEDEEKKLELMQDLARFYVDTVQDPEAAIELQEKMIEIHPEDRTILNDALDLYHLCEEWEKVSKTVLKLADMEEPGLLKSKYHFSAGLIFEEEIGDTERALEQYNKCLDNDPENQEVFEKVIKIQEEREDWHNMARSIRSHLKRSNDYMQNIKLWDKLGNIYLDKMGDPSTAVAAFEAAAKLDNSPERNDRLAQLYISQGPEQFEKAEEKYFRILEDDPEQTNIIRNVLELAIANEEKDKVWNLCGVLETYNEADRKEKLFYRKYAPKNFKRATSIVTDELWNKLQSSEEDRDLNKILSGLGHFLSIFYALPHKDYGLKRKNSVDLDNNNLPFVSAYKYAAKVLLIKRRPELYFKEGLPIPIQLANTREKETFSNP
jgi:tetratricopeptide (TPR) repeat protein